MDPATDLAEGVGFEPTGRQSRPAVFKTAPDIEKAPENKAISSHQGRLAHYLPTDTRQTDPDLARIVDAWPTLPESVRASIALLVKAASK
jgi:hypothetical protein